MPHVTPDSKSRMHEKLQALYDHCLGLGATAGEPPRWAAFDPMDVPHLLPNIFLFRVTYDPLRFQFRLLGDAVLASGGPGRRGLYVDEIPTTGQAETLHDQLAQVVAAATPFWYKGPPTLKHHRHVQSLEGVMIPMSDDTGRISHILCLTVYDWHTGTSAYVT